MVANADISLIWVFGCENDDFLGGSCVSREWRVVSTGLSHRHGGYELDLSPFSGLGFPLDPRNSPTSRSPCVSPLSPPPSRFLGAGGI